MKQNGSSKRTSLVSPVLNTSHRNVLSNYFPSISVANQAYRSVDGSPARSVTVGEITKNSVSSSSQRRVASSKTSLRNSLKAMESMSVTESQEVSRPEDRYPSKRPRLEDKAVFDNFFIKKEQIQSGGSEPKSSLHSTAATQNSTTLPSQSQRVNCPVCQSEVLASQINEHLDWCLDGDNIKVKS